MGTAPGSQGSGRVHPVGRPLSRRENFPRWRGGRLVSFRGRQIPALGQQSQRRHQIARNHRRGRRPRSRPVQTRALGPVGSLVGAAGFPPPRFALGQCHPEPPRGPRRAVDRRGRQQVGRVARRTVSDLFHQGRQTTHRQAGRAHPRPGIGTRSRRDRTPGAPRTAAALRGNQPGRRGRPPETHPGPA